MSMRGEEIDIGVEIQRVRRPIAAPVLKSVPRLRSAQDQNGASGVPEIVGITRGRERPRDRGGRGSRRGLGALRADVTFDDVWARPAPAAQSNRPATPR